MPVSDPIAEDTQQLVSDVDNFDEFSTEEKQSLLRERLNTEEYDPTGETPAAQTSMYNPVVSLFEEHGVSEVEWINGEWKPVECGTELPKFQEYTPTDETLEAIIEASPLVEIGAGEGYLSHIINQNGGECIPTDMHGHTCTKEHPHPQAQDEFPVVHWGEVLEIDAVDAVTEYSGRNVLLCHPSGDTRWTEEVLDALSDNQLLIFIGEWYPGMDATPMFFKRLDENWNHVADYPVYNWWSSSAHCHFFKKGSGLL